MVAVLGNSPQFASFIERDTASTPAVMWVMATFSSPGAHHWGGSDKGKMDLHVTVAVAVGPGLRSHRLRHLGRIQ